jgi:acyl-CoA thioester hydrolase
VRAVADRFRFPISANTSDIDELEHVSNLVYVRWVLDAATAHSRAVGWGHAEYRALGAVFVVHRHEIDYLAQVTVGEDLIATTWVDSWRAASCVRHTEIARGDRLVSRAATTWAFVAYANGRPRRIPDELRAAFS